MITLPGKTNTIEQALCLPLPCLECALYYIRFPIVGYFESPGHAIALECRRVISSRMRRRLPKRMCDAYSKRRTEAIAATNQLIQGHILWGKLFLVSKNQKEGKQRPPIKNIDSLDAVISCQSPKSMAEYICDFFNLWIGCANDPWVTFFQVLAWLDGVQNILTLLSFIVINGLLPQLRSIGNTGTRLILFLNRVCDFCKFVMSFNWSETPFFSSNLYALVGCCMLQPPVWLVRWSSATRAKAATLLEMAMTLASSRERSLLGVSRQHPKKMVS